MNQITAALNWIQVNQPEQYPQKFLQLVPLRCELRKMLCAKEENPAIAAYGESQKGKSYLMGNLLQKNGKPFKVLCDGQKYDFVNEINPDGRGREATGVVTRFTSYVGKEDRWSEKYPARMKVMSVAHVVTILVDGYFNDLTNYEIGSDKEIQDKADELYRMYAPREVSQNYLIEDDIIDIKLYLQTFYGAKFDGFCKNTNYFDQIAQVIRKVPQSEWINVFRYLWHDNDVISSLFGRLLACIQKLKFSPVVYLPINALLHRGDNKNTIMSVDCLNGLYSNTEPLFTDVFVKMDDGSFTKFSDVNMSELSALCLELVFKVDTDYLDDDAKFYYDPAESGNPGFMSADVYAKLTRERPSISKKELLKVSDLMDFPGAKNREQMRVETLSRLDPNTQQANLVKLFLRGKVSFLFNYFSDSRALNVLMFCHNSDDVKVTSMHNVIQKWVKTYVGETPEKRRQTLKLSGGISPFFAIGTMFNKDMVENSSRVQNSPTALLGRWHGRFSKVLYQDCFHAGTDADWFNDWTAKSVPFNNIYVLRDFKYSGCDGQGNNLYRGYDQEATHPAESELALSPEFYKTLMTSFVSDSENVGRFFADAQVAWEAAATMNNDGALYIIQQLCIVANHLFDVRQSQFESRADDIRAEVLSLIGHYYKTNDTDKKLKENIQRAFDVLGEFDACLSDNSFFGRFIEMLQLSDDEVYNIVHDLVTTPEMVEEVVSFQNVEAIRLHTIDFGPCNTVDDVLEKIMEAYSKPSKEAALKFLEEKHIDPQQLLDSAHRPQRKNSWVIAERLMKFWRDKISSSSFLSRLTAGSLFQSGVMSDLIDTIKEMADFLHLRELLSDSVSELTNKPDSASINQYLVTDILRHLINSFVTDFGFSLIDGPTVDHLKKLAAAQPKQFTVRGAIEPEPQSEFTEEELTAIFSEVMSRVDGITPSFWRHYNAWLECMYYAYLATAGQQEIIDDPVANEKIGLIISSLNEAV